MYMVRSSNRNRVKDVIKGIRKSIKKINIKIYTYKNMLCVRLCLFAYFFYFFGTYFCVSLSLSGCRFHPIWFLINMRFSTLSSLESMFARADRRLNERTGARARQHILTQFYKVFVCVALLLLLLLLIFFSFLCAFVNKKSERQINRDSMYNFTL